VSSGDLRIRVRAASPDEELGGEEMDEAGVCPSLEAFECSALEQVRSGVAGVSEIVCASISPGYSDTGSPSILGQKWVGMGSL